MTYNNENAMMETKKDFILPAMVEDDCISVDVSEDYEGLRLSFPRVKIPGGGSLQFEIPSDDPENPDYTKYIEGVILYNHDTCAYWPEGSEYDDNVTPLCSSVDGKTGYGAPGGVCATCALNQYGSVEKGKGKACKNMRNLYILRSGEHMPMLLSLPPTSLRPYSDFITAAFAAVRFTAVWCRSASSVWTTEATPTVWLPSAWCRDLRATTFCRSNSMRTVSVSRSKP